MTAAPGWYPDPEFPAQTRWWDGVRWTDDITPPEPVSALPPPAVAAVAASPERRSAPLWLWIVAAALAVVGAVFLSPIIAIGSLVVLITAIVALVKDTATWLRFPSRRVAVWALIVAAVLFFATGGVTAAMYPTETGTPIGAGSSPGDSAAL